LDKKEPFLVDCEEQTEGSGKVKRKLTHSYNRHSLLSFNAAWTRTEKLLVKFDMRGKRA
jgi:hypothetical protein